MYALFLETEAAQQIDRYAQDKGVDAEEIKKQCYDNAVEQGKGNDWWFKRCIDEDDHKSYSVDVLFTWRDTKQGHEFWKDIQDW